MRLQLIQDAEQRPELFDWKGPVDSAALTRWAAARKLQLPTDLLEIWRQTGGGEMFESESLLTPLDNAAQGDDVDSANASNQERGMPPGYLLFHVGLCRSAVRLADGTYVVFKPGGFDEECVFSSFDDWYRKTIRDEYAQRYGIY